MSVAEKLKIIAKNEQKVFDAGKKSYYDKFWDDLQRNGNRTNYDGAFGSWSGESFKPKYDIKVSSAIYMFTQFADRDKWGNGLKVDLVDILEKQNVNLDFSKCVNFTNFLLWSNISRIGTVDTSSASRVDFNTAHLLETIKLLILKNDGTQTFTFGSCNSLKNITIQGIIGTSIDMRSCPLSKESIISVVNALSSTTSRLTVTFKKSAINTAFGIDVDDETTYPEGSEYYVLRNTKSNWTFSYV